MQKKLTLILKTNELTEVDIENTGLSGKAIGNRQQARVQRSGSGSDLAGEAKGNRGRIRFLQKLTLILKTNGLVKVDIENKRLNYFDIENKGVTSYLFEIWGAQFVFTAKKLRAQLLAAPLSHSRLNFALLSQDSRLVEFRCIFQQLYFLLNQQFVKLTS